MAKEKKKVSYNPEEAEQKIRSLLGPWIFRIFRLKYRQLSIDDSESVMGYPYAAQERAARERQLLWDKEAIRGAWEAETRSFPQLANELSSIMQQTRGPLIEGVKVFSRAFLLEYRRIMGGALDWKDSDWMSDEELKDLADLAVFTYLEMWLEKDKASYLTIESFANHGYGRASDTSDDHQERIAWKAALYRAYEANEDMYKKGQLQKKELSERTHPAPYKVDNKRKLSLLDLAWCEAWASGKIEILKLLFFRKTLPNRKSEHDAMQNELLRDALNRYAQFVNGIRDGYPTDEERIDQYKAYIARCILIQRLERAYHFSLAGHMAEYTREHECSPIAYDKVLLSSYIGVYQDEEWSLVLSKQLLGEDGLRKYKKTFYPYRTLGFDDIVDQIFETTDYEKIQHMIHKELHQRAALDNLTTMLANCIPFGKKHWKDEDFREAATFLKNEYQFLEKIMVWGLPVVTGPKEKMTQMQKAAEKRAQKFLDYFYAYYLRLYEDEQTQTKKIVQMLTEPKKKGKKAAKK